jgi:hypothetical protein
VFENRVLRRIFGPKGEKVAGGWRRLHNEELRNSYPSQNIIRVIKSRWMRWAGHVACVGDSIAYKILVERPRHRWEDDIEMNLREMRCEGVGLVTSG